MGSMKESGYESVSVREGGNCKEMRERVERIVRWAGGKDE